MRSARLCTNAVKSNMAYLQIWRLHPRMHSSRDIDGQALERILLPTGYSIIYTICVFLGRIQPSSSSRSSLSQRVVRTNTWGLTPYSLLSGHNLFIYSSLQWVHVWNSPSRPSCAPGRSGYFYFFMLSCHWLDVQLKGLQREPEYFLWDYILWSCRVWGTLSAFTLCLRTLHHCLCNCAACRSSDTRRRVPGWRKYQHPLSVRWRYLKPRSTLV